MSGQLLGPVFNLVGDGGFGALTIGSWFTVKSSNLIMLGVVMVLFLLAMSINLPEAGDERVATTEGVSPIESEVGP